MRRTRCVAALKELLSTVNTSLPTDGTKAKLVERFVWAKQLERGLEARDDDESEKEGEEEEEEESEVTLGIACAGDAAQTD